MQVTFWRLLLGFVKVQEYGREWYLGTNSLIATRGSNKAVCDLIKLGIR